MSADNPYSAPKTPQQVDADVASRTVTTRWSTTNTVLILVFLVPAAASVVAAFVSVFSMDIRNSFGTMVATGFHAACMLFLLMLAAAVCFLGIDKKKGIHTTGKVVLLLGACYLLSAAISYLVIGLGAVSFT